MATFTIRTGAMDPDGTRETLTFWCPDRGGYVYLESPGNSGRLGSQITQPSGSTIATRSGEDLPRVIRAYLRAYRRSLPRLDGHRA